MSSHQGSRRNLDSRLGSFFFIHDSRNKNDLDEKEAAFVFLHKTFYEFLVADLVLRDLFIAVDWVNERKSSKKNGSQYYWEALNHPDSFSETFYAVISGGCLCMEPGIIQMIAEWQERKLYDYFGSEQSPFNSIVCQVMEDIFHSHMAMIAMNCSFFNLFYRKLERSLCPDF